MEIKSTRQDKRAKDHSINVQKSSKGGRGSPEKEKPTAIERYLKGINYPATKSELLVQAKNNGAPENVINFLNQFGTKFIIVLRILQKS